MFSEQKNEKTGQKQKKKNRNQCFMTSVTCIVENLQLSNMLSSSI